MSIQTPKQEQIRKHLSWIAIGLDSRFEFLGIRIGWDGILGLIPIFGDVLTTAVSIYIILGAWQLGLPFPILLRMGLNIVVDNLVSGIPILGWFFDFMFRSNLKNIDLVDRYFEHPTRIVARSRLLIGGLLAGVIGTSAALIAAFAWVFYQLFHWIILNLFQA